MIMVGTLKSRYIRELVKAKKIDASLLEGKNEKYLMTVVSAPLNGVNEALVIAGSDKRGTIYGIYELSEQIGVSPWYDWVDVPVMPRQNLSMMSSDKTHIKKAFERLGILKYFTDIVTCSQIGKGKTSPDIYIACADKLGTAPSETLVFEDAVFAAETAHKAGFKTVGVYDESSRNDKNRIKAVCDYYADSFEKAADWGHHLLSL